MKRAGFAPILNSLLLLVTTWPSVGFAAAAAGARSVSHEVHFRDDDFRAQRLAKKLIAKEIAQEGDMSSELQPLRTAWVKVSPAEPAALFIKYDCAPVGNCDLYGYELSESGWRMVLNSFAQKCLILPSSHGGRRDIVASMHDSATETTIKTYWWRKNRYVRVSERNVIYK